MITTTLDQSQKLKELSAPQDTYFWWTHCPIDKIGDEWTHVLTPSRNNQSPETVAAYTLSELLEWLGDDFEELVRGKMSKEFLATSHARNNQKVGTTPLEAVFNLACAIKGENE